MATKVLDSWALLAFFEGEPAADEVKKILLKAEDGTHKLLLSVINWGEVYYSVMRATSKEKAETTVREIAGMPIEVIAVGEDLVIARQAASYKATRKMSYADCFAAALSKIRNAELITGDQEFKEVEGEIKIGWLK